MRQKPSVLVSWSDEELALVKKYAWRIARSLTKAQRVFLDAILYGGVREFAPAVNSATAWMVANRSVAMAREGEREVVSARAEPAALFPRGSGLKRFYGE